MLKKTKVYTCYKNIRSDGNSIFYNLRGSNKFIIGPKVVARVFNRVDYLDVQLAKPSMFEKSKRGLCKSR